MWDVESEQEEHSLSLSQHSSPSQSDQEQAPGHKVNASLMDSQRYHLFKQINRIPSNCQHENGTSNKRAMNNITPRSPQDLHLLDHQPKQEQYVHVHEDRKGAQYQAADQKPVGRGHVQHLVDPLLFKFHKSTLLKKKIPFF